MRKKGDESQKQTSGGGRVAGGGVGGGAVSRSARSSFRALSNCLRVVSSGASTVARSALSAASAIVDRDSDSGHDKVLWAGFDKLESDNRDARRVLLLGFLSGFQVWDVEEADNVHVLVSSHDHPVPFMQMLPNLIESKRSEDKFLESRPLLALSADSSCGDNGNIRSTNDLGNESLLPTSVHFYSLKSQSYVHMLKFRSIIYTVRCSSRIVAILQAAQIHCFDSATLEREYTILTNPIASGFGVVGHGPLAVGPRWLAYSGSLIIDSNSGHVSPQCLIPSTTFSRLSSNGNLVAQYAKESGKQLASGIVTLSDKGCKKFSRYCSEILPDSNNSLQLRIPGWKGNVTVNGHLLDADNIGMVIVRDIVSKNIISQFRAHKSPISALCFDTSGTLLATASVQGHNINVYKIMPGISGSASMNDASASSMHLYRLQRGFTDAVIQDICFSNESNWIMISSSRGTSHLFKINPDGEVNLQPIDGSLSMKNSKLGFVPPAPPTLRWPPCEDTQLHNQQSFVTCGSPIALSAISKIRNGGNGWMGSVTGAAAAATGRASSIPGAIASTFGYCKGHTNRFADNSTSTTKCHLLVFTPSGCMIQYALRMLAGHDNGMSELNTDFESVSETEGRLAVEAIQKWTICQKQSRREREDHTDGYGGTLDCSKIYPEDRPGNHPHEDAGKATKTGNNYPEEKRESYISEAELQTHHPYSPLWAKPKFSFQSMVLEGINLDEENAAGGEIEIERIPGRMIEARPKDLVPVFSYLQPLKFQQLRVSALDSNRNGQMLNCSSSQSENFRLSSRSSSYSLDSSSNAEADEVTTSHGDPESSTANNGSYEAKSPLALGRVYSNAGSSGSEECQTKSVNNHNTILEKNIRSEDQDDNGFY